MDIVVNIRADAEANRQSTAFGSGKKEVWEMFPVRANGPWAFYRRFTGVWRRVKRDLVEMQLVPAFVANVCMWIWLDEPIVESGLRAALFLFLILAVADHSISFALRSVHGATVAPKALR